MAIPRPGCVAQTTGVNSFMAGSVAPSGGGSVSAAGAPKIPIQVSAAVWAFPLNVNRELHLVAGLS